MKGPPTRGVIHLDALEAWHALPLWSGDEAWWDEVARVLHTEARSLADYMQTHSGGDTPARSRPHWNRKRLPQAIRADALQLEQELLALFDN